MGLISQTYSAIAWVWYWGGVGMVQLSAGWPRCTTVPMTEQHVECLLMWKEVWTVVLHFCISLPIWFCVRRFNFWQCPCETDIFFTKNLLKFRFLCFSKYTGETTGCSWFFLFTFPGYSVSYSMSYLNWITFKSWSIWDVMLMKVKKISQKISASLLLRGYSWTHSTLVGVCQWKHCQSVIYLNVHLSASSSPFYVNDVLHLKLNPEAGPHANNSGEN